VSSPADGTPYGAKQNEDQSDDQEDDPNHPQNGDLGDESDYQQDEAQSDHLFSLPVTCSVLMRTIRQLRMLPCAKWSSPPGFAIGLRPSAAGTSTDIVVLERLRAQQDTSTAARLASSRRTEGTPARAIDRGEEPPP
jgi:hypothetical protein